MSHAIGIGGKKYKLFVYELTAQSVFSLGLLSWKYHRLIVIQCRSYRGRNHLFHGRMFCRLVNHVRLQSDGVIYILLGVISYEHKMHLRRWIYIKYDRCVHGKMNNEELMQLLALAAVYLLP